MASPCTGDSLRSGCQLIVGRLSAPIEQDPICDLADLTEKMGSSEAKYRELEKE
jgi:hypothetical protein